MEQINITASLYGSIVCLILTCYLVSGKRYKIKANRYFAVVCGANVGMQLGDITNWACEGFTRSWYPAALHIGSFIYYLCAAPILLAFTAYVINYLSPKVKVNNVFWTISVILGSIYIICTFLSPINGMFYYIDAGNNYRRGEWFLLSQAIPFAIYIIDVLIILIYSKHLKKSEIMLFLSYVLFPGIAQLIQIRYYGIALMNVGITISLLLIFVNIHSEQELRIKQQEVELTDARVDIMISQINPHFLYNSLTTIRQLCGINPIQAKQAVTDFSKFLRANMNSLTNKFPIPFENELNHTKHYLNLEKQRFGERLIVEYNITAQDFSIPPLTLQPIAENAVRHGIMMREEGGTITITTEEKDKSYVVTVTDNGVGFSDIINESEHSANIGINNVKSRLSSMSNGKLEFDSQPDKGTTVRIIIPKEDAL